MTDQIERFLVTTADERSWRSELPTLFLNERCRHYSRRNIWSKMDAMVANFRNEDLIKKKSQIKYLEELYVELLGEVSSALNEFHNVDFSQRYWGILIGHWLRRCLEVIYDRYASIENLLKTQKISESILFESDNFDIASTDSASFIWLANSDIWNNIIYAKILKYFGYANFITARITTDIPTSGNYPSPFFKSRIKKFINKILSLYSTKSDAVIIASYLPFWCQIKLQIALFQCPQFWVSPNPPRTPVNTNYRQGFNLNFQDHNGFNSFVRDLIPQIMPTCYLEGYGDLCSQTENLPWPKNPKFIFTSNSYDNDEVFKAWAAKMVDFHGTPYFTGQHGNNYGTHINYGSSISPERSTSDGFFAWGAWGGESQNVISSFMFKIGQKKIIKHNLNGSLLLVQQGVPLRIYADDPYSKHEQYQESQFLFIKSLPPDISSEVEVRLFRHLGSEVWSDIDRWRDRSPQTKLIDDVLGGVTILELFARSRITVFSFDSTGILEALFLNMPMICFWSEGFNHLLPDAKPYYQLLVDANILFTDPVLAAKHIARHWEDVDKWWNSKFVQEARKVFCERYAATEKYPTLRLKNLLLERAKFVHNNKFSEKYK